MPESELCNNCVCLPICKIKTISGLIDNCMLMKINLRNMTESTLNKSALNIYFIGLDREIRLFKNDTTLHIYANSSVYEVLLSIDDIPGVIDFAIALTLSKGNHYA